MDIYSYAWMVMALFSWGLVLGMVIVVVLDFFDI